MRLIAINRLTAPSSAIQNGSRAERFAGVAPSTVQVRVCISFVLRIIHFTFGVKEALHLSEIELLCICVCMLLSK